MRLALVIFLFCLPQAAWPQAGRRQLQVNPDTALQGPAPTDTSRNAVNEFLRDFYSSYPTDFNQFAIPDGRREERVVPELNFRIRPVRDSWQLLMLAIL